MEAIFVVPTMVSPQVEPRLVPALSKLVERNIILTNASNIRIAALKKYTGSPWKTSYTEDSELFWDNPLTEGRKGISGSAAAAADKAIGNGARSAGEFLFKKADDTLYSGGSREDRDMETKTSMVDSYEMPRGLTFYNVINLEPTYLQIKASVKGNIMGLGGPSDRLIRIGVKCVPYTVDGVTDILKLMADLRSGRMRKIESGWKGKWSSIKKRVSRSAARRFQPTGKSVTDIIQAPSVSDISDPGILSKMMDNRGPAYWSPLTIFSYFDFKKNDLKDSLRNYRTLVKAGWGDMVVLHEPNESVYFCTQRMMSCFEMPIAYLRLHMKLDPILDYSEIVRGGASARPFRTVPLRKSMMENVDEVSDDISTQDTVSMINKELRG